MAHDTRFEPFADEASVHTIGGLSFENGRARIALHGSLEIPRDRAGLALARDLKRAADAVHAALESADLPDRAAEPAQPAPTRVRNPFT